VLICGSASVRLFTCNGVNMLQQSTAQALQQ
jgi:hypothetical protein